MAEKNYDYVVKLGPRANSFYDAGSGIKVLKGQQKALRKAQYNLPAIRRAVSHGHLVIVPAPEVIRKGEEIVEKVGLDDDEVAKYVKVFEDAYEKGLDAQGIAKILNLDKLKLVLHHFNPEAEVEEGTKKIEVAQSIIEEIESK